jgi:hypothetical protein
VAGVLRCVQWRIVGSDAVVVPVELAHGLLTASLGRVGAGFRISQSFDSRVDVGR